MVENNIHGSPGLSLMEKKKKKMQFLEEKST